MQITKEQIIEILCKKSSFAEIGEINVEIIYGDDFSNIADEILTLLQSNDAGQPNGSKPDVMRSLPPIDEIETALNLAQCELRSLYRRIGIKESNVLKDVDTTLGKIWAAMPS